MFNPLLRDVATLLDPWGARLSALHKGVAAAAESVAEFFRLLPSALASGAADTMAAHGRDPNAGLALAFNFEAADPDDWEESMRFHREMQSFFQASNGFPPTEHQHMGLYFMVKQGQDSSYR